MMQHPSVEKGWLRSRAGLGFLALARGDRVRNWRQDIWCACHNGVYDLNGKNISCPPPRPLEPFKVNVRGDQIVVMKR